jgi:hypothetical protein
VPVALNLYKIREQKGPAGEFFRSVYRQKPQYQGLWVVAPDGKALASHSEMKERSEWTKRVLADLKAGLAAFGAVKPREPQASVSAYQAALPFRGSGTKADGSVALALYNKYVIVQDLEREPPPGALGETVLDSIPLTAAEWLALAPPKSAAGSVWTVPETVARRFYPLLSVSSVLFRDSGEVTRVRLAGRVDSVRDGIAALTYDGEIAGTHLGTADEGKAGNKISSEAKLLSGVGSYDVRARRMRSLTLVFDGRARNWAPYDDPPTRFGAVVEWTRTGVTGRR